ncbi:MAG: 50S ribosomal protein L5 [Nanoarchaeota archaeon]
MNNMRDVYVEKVTLNIGTGGPGESLDKAIRLLNNITNAKPVPTKTNRRIPAWDIRPGLQIGCKVTLRKKKAHELLLRLFTAKGNKLQEKNFDDAGNVSFGILEYLDIPGVEYDMQIGIIGLEAAVTLARPGFRIKNRRIAPRRISKKVRINKEESIKFIRDKYGVIIER